MLPPQLCAMGLTRGVLEHRLLERHPTASQARIHRAQRDLERFGNLFAGHVLELEENEHRTLVEIEVGQRQIEECEIFLALDHRRSVVTRVGLNVQIRIVEHLVANVGAPAVVLGHAHANPEEPGRQLGSLDESGRRRKTTRKTSCTASLRVDSGRPSLRSDLQTKATCSS